MDSLFSKLKRVFKDRSLRKKILFVLGALAVFRVLAAVPIPGIDIANLEQFFSQNQFLGLLNIFSGGGLSNLSVVMLGVGPYITASIIMQLLTIVFPRLKALYHEEGAADSRGSWPSRRLFISCVVAGWYWNDGRCSTCGNIRLAQISCNSYCRYGAGCCGYRMSSNQVVF